MDFMTYFKQLKSNEIKQVTLINGDESYLIDNLTKYIADNFLLQAYLDFNLTIIDGIMDIDSIESIAMTLPFFDEKRIILFQNSGLLKAIKDEQEEKLINFINQLPEHLIVIFVETELDKRKKIYKQISKIADLVTVDRLSRQELVKWCAKRFKLYNKEVDLHVINFLIEMVNYLEPEADKNLYDMDNTIRMLAGISGQVTESVIRQYVDIPIEHNIFKMMDAMSSKHISDALTILTQIISNGEAEIKVFYMINQQYRNIYKTKLLLEAGHSSQTIASKLDIHPFVAKKAGGFASHFTVKQLIEIISVLEEVDIAMKSSGIKPLLLIEKAFFQIGNIA
ncbi:DNA polymerase III subunit delta [Fusibacter bizertensis]